MHAYLAGLSTGRTEPHSQYTVLCGWIVHLKVRAACIPGRTQDRVIWIRVLSFGRAGNLANKIRYSCRLMCCTNYKNYVFN
jgi:hypothetical protein